MNKEEFKDELRSILVKDGSYALEQWTQLSVIHNGLQGRKVAYRRINEAFKSSCAKGVYVYMKGKVCLYVGQGNLRGRVKMHYDESLPEKRERFKGKSKDWFEFFGAPENQGEMRIFWKQMNDRDNKAKVIEQMLMHVLEPQFERKYRWTKVTCESF